jgi:hypothetical protein
VIFIFFKRRHISQNFYIDSNKTKSDKHKMNIRRLEMNFYLLILDCLEYALICYLELREWCNQHDRELCLIVLSCAFGFVFYCFYMEEDRIELQRMETKLKSYQTLNDIPVVELAIYKATSLVSRIFRGILPFV